MSILRIERAATTEGASATWPCAWCGDEQDVADGWIVTHEDAVPGQALKAFVCDGCAVAEARRTRAHAAHGRQRCARCRRRRPEAESAVLEQVDDVTGDAFRVPLCRACADTELARLRDTMTSGV